MVPFETWNHEKENQAGNGPSCRHIYSQKLQKDFKVPSILFYSTRMRKNFLKKSQFFQFFFGPR